MRKYPDFTGKRFGMLTVVEQLSSTPGGQRRWLCVCACGGEHTATSYNLTSGRTTNCGCKKSPDLTGRVFGKLTVLGRSNKRSPRGERTCPTWECRCECGAITYKATDTLTNPDTSMCQACAAEYAITQARASLGFVNGTQITKINNHLEESKNLSGVRGVYLDSKTGKYRARLRFRGKSYDFGSYTLLEDAAKARRRGEEEIFDTFLASLDAKCEPTAGIK